MRLKPSIIHLLLSLLLASGLAVSVNAQEDRQVDGELIIKENLRNEPDPGLTDAEMRSGNKPPVVPTSVVKETQRDSVAQVKTLKPARTVEKVPKEEDPLSFNFLYYIIEKFKLSDIIE